MRRFNVSGLKTPVIIISVWLVILLLLISSLPSCGKFNDGYNDDSSVINLRSGLAINNMCDCVDSLKTPYWVETRVDDSLISSQVYLPTTLDYLNFIQSYADSSAQWYDFDGNGVVGSNDLTIALSGYGYHMPNQINLCDVSILFHNSHGWQASYPGAYFTIVGLSSEDESGQSGSACPLNTFSIDLIYDLGGGSDSTITYWYH